MNNYKTLLKRASASFTERKSEFIGHICPISSGQEALNFLEEVRSQNRKANHNCYAYKIRSNSAAGGSPERYSDDGEPSGTAGMPILDVLQKKDLTDVICVVTRYFGGVLLGAGGLVRAYSKAASLAVAEAGVRTYNISHKISVMLEYPLYGLVERALTHEGVQVIERDFSSKVVLILHVREDIAEKYIADLIDLCNGAIVVKTIQKEYYDFG